MINIDFLTLKAFFLENIDFLIGARIQKIQQPTRKDFIFLLRNNSQSQKLYVNINPQIYHLSFMSKKNEQRRNIKIPKQPPMFCMLLRKYLDGNRISDACVIENERIFELHFEITDEFSQNRRLCLAFELMGKHSNVILYDMESKVIIGCAHNVGAEKSRYRELQGGMKYIYPPKHGGVVLSDELKRQFDGLSPTKVQEYLSTEVFSPAVKDDRYTLFKELLPDSLPVESVSDMLDEYYSEFQMREIISEGKNKLKNIVNTKLNKINSSKNKIELLLKKRDNIEEYKLFGELLTANIYQKIDYREEAELFDYVNNCNVKIALDKTKTMSENAQRYFKLYTKSKKTKEHSKTVLEKLIAEKEYLEQVIYSIDSAQNSDELEEIADELCLNQNKTAKKAQSPIMKVNINGFDVYIGKNNRQNDFIISKLSKDDDYWFHTRLCAGSHVLLKVLNTEPDDETIFECCKLARKFSSASMPSKVGVVYTKRKYIKKPPSAPLGYVIYKNEKEIMV